MGTPDFACESLKAIYEANYNIIGVVTNPDKPKGRGMKLQSSPVKEFALEKNIKIFQPIKIRNNEEFENEIKQLKPDIVCVVAYGKILPQSFLDIPKYGCINVHGSLLPKYRGAAPIQRAVLNGDKETGITTMFMDAGMDTGDMILTHKIEITPNETTGELWDKMSILGGKMLVKTLQLIDEKISDGCADSFEELKEKVGAQKQGEDFSLPPMLSKEEASIDWNNYSAQQIHNLVRGLNPIMVAVTHSGNKTIKIWKTEIVDEQELVELGINSNDYKIGQVVYANTKKGLIVKALEGYISILEIQPENSKRLSFAEFINGQHVTEGYFFE